MFDNIVLDEEQIELLSSLIERLAGVPRDKRVSFIGTRTSDGTAKALHAALLGPPITLLPEDIEALARVGFVSLTPVGVRDFKFAVTPMGRKYYEMRRGNEGPPGEQLSKQVKAYIVSEGFRNNYPSAFERWSRADFRLWANESHSELSVIGHLCREAMQEFVNVLVDKYQPLNVDPIKAHDINRLESVLRHCSSAIPTTLPPFIESLLSYWETLNKLVQRQEHAGQKEGQPVDWPDAKRVVFHTAVIFLEVDTALSAIS